MYWAVRLSMLCSSSQKPPSPLQQLWELACQAPSALSTMILSSCSRSPRWDSSISIARDIGGMWPPITRRFWLVSKPKSCMTRRSHETAGITNQRWISTHESGSWKGLCDDSSIIPHFHIYIYFSYIYMRNLTPPHTVPYQDSIYL